MLSHIIILYPIKQLLYSCVGDVKIVSRMINSFYLNLQVLVICRGFLKNRVRKHSEVTSRVRREIAVADARQNGQARGERQHLALNLFSRSVE